MLGQPRLFSCATSARCKHAKRRKCAPSAASWKSISRELYPYHDTTCTAGRGPGYSHGYQDGRLNLSVIRHGRPKLCAHRPELAPRYCFNISRDSGLAEWESFRRRAYGNKFCTPGYGPYRVQLRCHGDLVRPHEPETEHRPALAPSTLGLFGHPEKCV